MTLPVIPHSLLGSEVISFAVQQGRALIEWKNQATVIADRCLRLYKIRHRNEK